MLFAPLDVPEISKKLLIVSPHFPPVAAPDHQRVRMMLPFLAGLGWRADILAVQSAYVEVPLDGVAEPLPEGVRVYHHRALPSKFARMFGVGNVGWRCLPFLSRVVWNLIHGKRYDLAFFSTTQFPALLIIPLLRKYRIPCVVDIQDPIVNMHYWRTDTPPPGGMWKFYLSHCLSCLVERLTAARADGLISVSPRYLEEIKNRYSEVERVPKKTIPFGFDLHDLDLAREAENKQAIFDSTNNYVHWVYCGRGGPDLETALRCLFLGWLDLLKQEPILAERIRFHFIGTSYAPAGLAKASIEPIAKQLGLEKVVDEIVRRLPLHQAIRCMQEADALIIPSSEDRDYSASKLNPCLMMGKPLYVLAPEGSVMADTMDRVHGAFVATWSDSEESFGAAVEKVSSWLKASVLGETTMLPDSSAALTAERMTREILHFFETVIEVSYS